MRSSGCGNENHNSASSDRSPRTCKERDGEVHPKDPGHHPNQKPIGHHPAWNMSHPKKGFIHQIDF